MSFVSSVLKKYFGRPIRQKAFAQTSLLLFIKRFLILDVHSTKICMASAKSWVLSWKHCCFATVTNGKHL